MVLIERVVHGPARLYFDEISDCPVLRIGSDLLDKVLEVLGIRLEGFETEESVEQFNSQWIPEIVVHQHGEGDVKKSGHRQMDAEMALISITHTLVQSRSIPRDAALRRGDSGIQISREFSDFVAVQFPLHDRGYLPDL